MLYKSKLSLAQALQKARHYCAYQERCHSEVKNKLYNFGLNTTDVNIAIATLIEENYLNEERLAIAFAGGKFRMKQWGKVKIRYELQQKQVSAANIKKALSLIDEDDYLQTAEKIFENYFDKLKGTIQLKHLKTKNHLLAKGFELSAINDISKNHKA